MDNKFGEYIRSLRARRTSQGEWGPVSWSRRTLAEAMFKVYETDSALPDDNREALDEKFKGKNSDEEKIIYLVQLVRRIESKNGAKNLRPYIELIARAFILQEGEKEGLYNLAGQTYISQHKPDLEALRSVFEKVPYPVFVRDRVWNILALNSHLRELFGYTPEKIARMKEGKLGANLLRVLFDEEFENAKYVLDWRSNVERAVRHFRVESSPYAHTKRYKMIIDQMQSQFPEFRRLWTLTEPIMSQEISKPVPPIAKVILQPEGEIIEFLSLRTSSRWLGTSAEVSIYVPVEESLVTYQKLVDRVKTNSVETFPIMELD
jgi:PAS domain-containing protein